MFIFTAKFSKKKAIFAILLLAIVLAVIVLIVAGGARRSVGTAALSAIVKDNEDRVKYLESLGWEVSEEAIEVQRVVIPKEFTSVYSEYNELQKTQGFDLSRYCGIEAMRYTYEVFNYPKVKDNVVADIIVYRGEVIAGDVQATALDGFMHGLRLPDAEDKSL